MGLDPGRASKMVKYFLLSIEICCLAKQAGEAGEGADPGLMLEVCQLKRSYLQLQAFEIVVLLLLLRLLLLLLRGDTNGFTFHRGLMDWGQNAQTCADSSISYRLFSNATT